MNYLDFDLSIETIESATGRYRARVVSPGGEASTEFVLPFSPVEIENYILKMGRPRQGRRGLNSSEGRAAQEFGRKLYDAIFQGEVRDCLRTSLNLVHQRTDEKSEQGLRLRLRLTDAPALADLPWEYLYDTSFRRFFAHSTSTPIVRYLDLPQRIQPLAVQSPLKILVMIANPRDVIQLNVEEEWRKVQAALADLVNRGLVTLTRLEKATLAALQRQLRRDQYHIFHFIGHGSFDQGTQEGVLVLENENGQVRQVAGSYIGALLHDHRSLRLAVLNSCEGARTAQSDPFAGVAQTLVQQGIPAVIAMQFEITDGAAITFAHEFYSALADRYPVDGALAEARKAIYAAGNDVEWGTPVLYLRAQDGDIFDVAAPREAPPAPPPKVEPEPVRPLPRRSIFQERSYWIGAALILLLLGGLWQGPRLAAALQRLLNNPPTPTPLSPTPTPTQTATATVTTLTPNSTMTAAANIAAQTAIAATKTALAPTMTITLTATSTLTPTATTTLTPTTVVTPTATATLTPTATATLAPTDTVTDIPTATPTGTATPRPIATPAEPAAGATKSIEGITFVYVPAGVFTMGSSDAQIDAAWQECQKSDKNCQRSNFEDEGPQQSLNVTGFWIMQTEVTNAQYDTFIKAGGYDQRDLWTTVGWKWKTDNKVTQPNCWTDDQWNKLDYPVVCVSWYEAIAYASWLAQKTGLKISLPAEAQWEKAARGPDGLIYPWGNNDPTDQLLNYNNKLGHTSKVGSYPDGKSIYGALDMAGNVWEWTSTLYMKYPYQPDDGRESIESVDCCRLVRGGSWDLVQYYVRAAVRDRNFLDPRNHNVGFRLVWSPGS